MLPNGDVSEVKPLQDDSSSLDEICNASIQQWKFEPVADNKPQVLQEAVIHFYY